jgi:hypothetical protein
MKKLLLLAFVLVLRLPSFAQMDTTISTFVNVHQGNGNGLATRTVTDTFLFPHDVSSYDSIQMTVLLNCPVGGCDPWDRFASIKINHNGEWYEIGRYMTPYGKSCGWTIDVSDYRNFLTDTVILESFIDTWTNPGWLVNIDFHFKAGTPAYQYIQIDNLWNDYNIVYGDTTQPVNIPEKLITINPDAQHVKVKIVNTGHGQGNLNNAAEFSQKTHHLIVNQSNSLSHLPWRLNCSTNPCSPQNGTWQYNRAGWCPGSDVIPAEYDVTTMVTPGMSNSFKYELQSYFNTCSPHNPGCVTSGSCPDCNYNYNGHTEPHYKLAGQVISYLNSPTGIKQPQTEHYFISPNPSTGIFTIHTDNRSSFNIQVYSTVGKLEWSGVSANMQSIDLGFLPSGIYMLKILSNKSATIQRIVIE